MSTDKLKAEIRALPYTDMKAFAGELATALKMVPLGASADTVAEALLSLPMSKAQPPSMEDQYLRRAFRRKRSITLEKEANGWTVQVSGIPGAHIRNPNLREGISQLLDVIVGLKAMES